MKKAILVFAAMGLAASSAWAAKHTYQVTGPVVEMNDNSIVVKKGSENWEIARDPSTKLEGQPAVGSKVTVEYTMTAATIEAKADNSGKKKKK